MKRRVSKKIKVGNVEIGGGAPIPVQSMATVKTSNVSGVVKQINELANAGCEIIRVSILDKADAQAIAEIKKEINIPLVADIHFDYNLAINAIDNGADKIRINPGNIGEEERVKKVILHAKENNIPVRIGANSGSIEESMFEKYKSNGQRLAYSALESVRFVQSLGFEDLVLSAKAQTVNDTVEAYSILAKETDCPLHLGVTSSGSGEFAVIKSSVGIGSLLQQGIGDTIRVSLTDNPVHEVKVGHEILQSLDLRQRDWEVVSCPTCGRTEIDVIGLAEKVEELLKASKIKLPKTPYRVAVMGCVVNGPGESREADIGISGGRGFGFIFKDGEMISRVDEKDLLAELIKAIENDDSGKG